MIGQVNVDGCGLDIELRVMVEENNQVCPRGFAFGGPARNKFGREGCFDCRCNSLGVVVSFLRFSLTRSQWWKADWLAAFFRLDQFQPIALVEPCQVAQLADWQAGCSHVDAPRRSLGKGSATQHSLKTLN